MQESVMLSPFFSSSFFSPHPTPACSRSFHLSVMGPLFVDLNQERLLAVGGLAFRRREEELSAS